VIWWETISLLLVGGGFLFQLINLAACACLLAIKTAGIEEEGSAYLFMVRVHGGCRQ
jgi:hypothetical protein